MYNYKGWQIEFNFYGRNEYIVHFCGDDIWFDTLEEAKDFINQILAKEGTLI